MSGSRIIILVTFLTSTRLEVTECKDSNSNRYVNIWNELKGLEHPVQQKIARVHKRAAAFETLRAVAEPQEDYYGQVQGDSDGEDYYEKREWSDTMRQAYHAKHHTVKVDHPDLGDIDGIHLKNTAKAVPMHHPIHKSQGGSSETQSSKKSKSKPKKSDRKETTTTVPVRKKPAKKSKKPQPQPSSSELD